MNRSRGNKKNIITSAFAMLAVVMLTGIGAVKSQCFA